MDAELKAYLDQFSSDLKALIIEGFKPVFEALDRISATLDRVLETKD